MKDNFHLRTALLVFGSVGILTLGYYLGLQWQPPEPPTPAPVAVVSPDPVEPPATACSESGPLSFTAVSVPWVSQWLDFGSIGPGDVATRSVRVQGAIIGSFVLACTESRLGDGLMFMSWVDRLNVVKIRVANIAKEAHQVGKLQFKIVLGTNILTIPNAIKIEPITPPTLDDCPPGVEVSYLVRGGRAYLECAF